MASGARSTLVATADGKRPIGQIEPGDLVYSFDFAAGNWVLAKVTNTKRHDNTYVGSVVTVHVGDTRIEATAGHPFWVIEGQNLHERALPHELNEHEDEGQSLAGRWVSSQELKVGDLVIGLDGAAKRVDRLAIREDTALPVSNLSVAQHHSYAVGQAGLLVHNKPAFCTPYRKALARLRDADGTIRIEPPESLLKIAEGPKANGKPRQIHAHHIVMDAENRWPIDWLKKCARYPHDHNTWLGGSAVIISNGEPPQRLAPHTPFTAVLLIILDEAVALPDGEEIQIYQMIPLYSEERDLEQRQGISALLEAFDRRGVSWTVDLHRTNVAL